MTSQEPKKEMNVAYIRRIPGEKSPSRNWESPKNTLICPKEKEAAVNHYVRRGCCAYATVPVTLGLCYSISA